jgi:DNA-binding transcriptional regulator GbsR (MarR family)
MFTETAEYPANECIVSPHWQRERKQAETRRRPHRCQIAETPRPSLMSDVACAVRLPLEVHILNEKVRRKEKFLARARPVNSAIVADPRVPSSKAFQDFSLRSHVPILPCRAFAFRFTLRSLSLQVSVDECREFHLFLSRQKYLNYAEPYSRTTKVHPPLGRARHALGTERTVAQIHALLYISQHPLPADEIASLLSVARSNVSTSLRELQGWRVVRVVHLMGDRRDHFDTIQDVSEMLTTILDERKKREIDPTLAVLRECSQEIDRGTAEDREARKRIKALLSFFEETSSLYDEFRGMSGGALKHILKLRGQLRRFFAGVES